VAALTDNFDRADGSIGAGWTVDNGSWNIVSNVAESGTVTITNRARYATQLDGIDHYVEATLGGKASGNHGGITARQASSTATYYYFYYNISNNATGFVLQRINGGTASNLAIYSAVGITGAQTLRMEISGTNPVTIRVYRGEVLLGTVADSHASRIQSGRYVGIAALTNTGGRVEDWSAGDISRGSYVSVIRRRRTK
jgi:hypothetical protein